MEQESEGEQFQANTEGETSESGEGKIRRGRGELGIGSTIPGTNTEYIQTLEFAFSIPESQFRGQFCATKHCLIFVQLKYCLDFSQL